MTLPLAEETSSISFETFIWTFRELESFKLLPWLFFLWNLDFFLLLLHFLVGAIIVKWALSTLFPLNLCSSCTCTEINLCIPALLWEQYRKVLIAHIPMANNWAHNIQQIVCRREINLPKPTGNQNNLSNCISLHYPIIIIEASIKTIHPSFI